MSKIVVADIPFGNAYAYRVGDRIEDDAVKQNKWEDYVAPPDSQAAKKVMAAIFPELEPTQAASSRAPRKTAQTAPAPPAPVTDSGEDK